MGSSLHNKIHLGGRLSRAQSKRLRVFKWLFVFSGVAAVALLFLALN